MTNEEDEFIERRILIGLIMKRKYLEWVEPFAEDLQRLLPTKWSQMLCGWTLDYYRRYGRQPKWSNIEAEFEDHRSSLDSDTEHSMSVFLTGLSRKTREGQAINIDQLTDQTTEYLRRRHGEVHDEQVNDLIQRGETERAEELRQNYRPLLLDDKGDTDLIWSNEVKSELQTWLWGGGKLSGYRIPLGETTIFAGDLEKGKSTCALDIAARVSNGEQWPIVGEGKAPRGDVLIISGEDKYNKTIKPRLEAAGADHRHVAFFKVIAERRDKQGRPIYRKWTVHDMTRLRRSLDKMPNPVLILIDPLSAFLGGREVMDSNNTTDIRDALYPLDNLMAERDLALISILHLNKNQSQLAIHRVSGSGALAQMPRSGFLFGQDANQPGRIIMARLKGNLTWDKTGMAFRIRGRDVIHDDGREGSLPVIEWENQPVDTDKDDLLSGKKPDSKVGEAVEWLSQQFTDAGYADLRAKEMEDKATDRGIKLNTLYRARQHRNVGSQRRGGREGYYVWVWPTADLDKFLQHPRTLYEVVEYLERNSPGGGVLDKRSIKHFVREYVQKSCQRTTDENGTFRYLLLERSDMGKIVALDSKRTKVTRARK